VQQESEKRVFVQAINIRVVGQFEISGFLEVPEVAEIDAGLNHDVPHILRPHRIEEGRRLDLMAKIIVGVVKVIAVRVDAVESVIAIGHPVLSALQRKPTLPVGYRAAAMTGEFDS